MTPRTPRTRLVWLFVMALLATSVAAQHQKPNIIFILADDLGYGDWKGLRRNLHRGNTKLELYHLAKDASEKNDLAAQHPDIVKRIEKIMREQHRASEVFPIQVLDQNKP